MTSASTEDDVKVSVGSWRYRPGGGTVWPRHRARARSRRSLHLNAARRRRRARRMMAEGPSVVSRGFRSGWCGIGARDWQPARCLGQYATSSACVCACHEIPAVGSLLAELVHRRDLVGLVGELEELTGLPGDVPPAVRRLHVAVVELLGEVVS